MELFGKKILVLAPHADDEVVGVAAAIARAQAAGADVQLAILTTGIAEFELPLPWLDAAYPKRIAARAAEQKKAADLLKLKTIWQGKYPSRTLALNIFQLYWEISALISQHQYDQLWVPAYEGGHPDHDTVNGIAAALRTTRSISVLEFAEYHWAQAKASTNVFIRKMNNEIIIKLTEAESAIKQQLLATYASEKRNLSYFDTKREMLRPLADYDYRLAPHEGVVWYNRFDWVPFPHPAICRLRPLTVSQAIINLFAAVVLPDPAAAPETQMVAAPSTDTAVTSPPTDANAATSPDPQPPATPATPADK